jgi:uncharacterized protein YbcI
MPDTQSPDGTVLAAVSTAMVTLHKEQFGRGPTIARSNFAGPDTLVCVLEDALLPAERALVELGEQHRVRETRTFYQVATAERFTEAVEALISREVRAFASAIDPDQGIAMEVFVLEPRDSKAPDASAS